MWGECSFMTIGLVLLQCTPESAVVCTKASVHLIWQESRMCWPWPSLILWCSLLTKKLYCEFSVCCYFFMLKLCLKTSTGRYMWPESPPLSLCCPFSSVGKLILWDERFGFCWLFTDYPLHKNAATLYLEKWSLEILICATLSFQKQMEEETQEKETENE